MRTFWRNATQRVHLPIIKRAERVYQTFSYSGKVLFLFFAGLLVVSSAGLVYSLENAVLVTSPAYGGSITEGIVGAPRFINPVLAVSDPDRDLSSLVYSGLLRATPEGGYHPDLASSYTVSEDGKTYTAVLRKNLTFHDGSPLTAKDVVFTIQKTQDATLKSPVRANWDGVTVTAVDDQTIQFELRAPYAPFIENLTLGILPKALWENVSDDEFPFSTLNADPIGSGPFSVASVSRTASGIASVYRLSPFGGYALGKPYLHNLVLRFYQSEEALLTALKNGDVDTASGLSPAGVASLTDFHIESAPLNRVFGVFFNQNQSATLRDRDVRQALAQAINQSDLVEKVLGGYGTPVDGPVPPIALGQAATTETASSTDALAAAAQQYLIGRGWKLNAEGILTKTTGSGKTAQMTELAFTLATGDVPELRTAAQYVAERWGAMGAKVSVQIYDQGDLSQNVIRPRKYDALLFGEVVGRELDLFAFWDSSQRNDPGLNIALYANSTADKILEQLRTTSGDAERVALYAQFKEQLDKDIPAVFLYAPDFVYSVPKGLQGLELGLIETPSDRFLSAPQWHLQTDYVWPIFAKQR